MSSGATLAVATFAAARIAGGDRGRRVRGSPWSMLPLARGCVLLGAVGALGVACGSDAPEKLFGAPVAQTGLSGDQCGPSCPSIGFVSRDFTPAEIAALRQWTNTAPYAELTADPYSQPVPPRPDGVCAIVIDDLAAKTYHPETFASPEAAAAAGAILTHWDACGLCSTLTDFAVYAEDRDLGAPVKQCGLDTFGKPFGDLVTCLEGLGFTTPCAQIWAYNVRNTGDKCLNECLRPDFYNQADGSLSVCLACDERESGPWFQAVAGRTRRNTGLASSICRPCSEVRPVAHDYPLN